MSERPAPVVLSRSLKTVRPSEENDRLSLLVYGPPGVGKTMFAATAYDDDRTSPVLYCDSEGGVQPITWRDELTVFQISDYERDLASLFDYFYGPAGIRNEDGYKTVVIDSLSDLAEKCMAAVLSQPNGKRAWEDVPEISDWNVWTNKVLNLINALKELPVHVIVTALETVETQGVMPMLPGRKLGPRLPAKFGTVGRLYVARSDTDKGTAYERRLLLQADNRYVAKDRGDPLSLLPRELAEPTVSKLLDRTIEGKRLARLRAKGNQQ